MIGQVSIHGLNPYQKTSSLSAPKAPVTQGASPSLSPQMDLSAATLDPRAGIFSALANVVQMISLMISGSSRGYSAQSLAITPPPLTTQSIGTAPIGLTSQDPRLNSTLQAVAQDPEGAKLLANAQANGYTIELGDPAAAIGAPPGQQVNGATLPDQKKIIINPNAPEFTKTVVHELVHAATTGDGNSQTEEGIADVIGYRVASRITGQMLALSPGAIFNNKVANYPGLPGLNGIRDTLASLGINPGI